MSDLDLSPPAKRQRSSAKNVVAFPRPRKRGPKTKRGPIASVTLLPSNARPEVAGHQILSSDKFQILVDAIHKAGKKQDEKMESLWQRLQKGEPCSAAYYGDGTSFGSATTTKGNGPAIYQWAKREVRDSEVLRFNEREEALSLAINALNSISHLVRFGGLQVGRASALEGFDESALQAYEYNCVSQLASLMVRLRAFGATDTP